MFEADCVKASVVDIVRGYDGFLQSSLAIDANVLYFYFYDNFRALWESGNSGNMEYRRTQYGRAIKKALQENVKLYTSHSVYGEVMATMEFSELEILRRCDHTLPPIDKFNGFHGADCKEARYRYREKVPAIREKLNRIINSAKELVELLPNAKGPDYMLKESTKEWIASLTDYRDSVLIASSRLVGFSQIMSDDCDIASHPDIIVYTANKRTIDSAREAGKLLNP